jgi:N utilization substance protein A
MANGGIKFDGNTIKIISLFESMTKARVKDCIDKDDIIFFIVQEGQLGQAIGKGGKNINQVKERLKKNIDVIEYSQDINRFIRNIFHKYKIKNIELDRKGKKPVALISVDIRDKGKVIGRNSRNLRTAKEIMSRYHDLDLMIVGS